MRDRLSIPLVFYMLPIPVEFSPPDMLAIYDELTALGCYVLPKVHDDKRPLPKYWVKDNPVIATREHVLADMPVSGWCVVTGYRSKGLIVFDLDTSEIVRNGHEPEEVYNQIQALAKTDFVIATPAGGYHLWYCVPNDLRIPTNAKPPIVGVDIRGEGGQAVTLGSSATYTGRKAVKKGVPDGHTGYYTKVVTGDYSHIPLATAELLAWLDSARAQHLKELGEDRTEVGERRLKIHAAKPADVKSALVMECLEWVLKSWQNKPYEDWLQLWMAAHHGSGGDPLVRDYIIENVDWSDGPKGIAKFRKDWGDHKPASGGYTVSSLFWLARQVGWLETSSYEITTKLYDTIDYRYIGEWVNSLTEIPERLLLTSQTGSGKTYALALLWKKLGRPRTVVFVPSTRLAEELAGSLINNHGIPATLYIDSTDRASLHGEVLASATFLVTTLQTFATKVYRNKAAMSDYGLVYIEEADQLLAQFARSGSFRRRSHVSGREADLGMSALVDAMQDSAVVWMVDATMTKVGETFFRQAGEGKNLTFVRNTYITPKPTLQCLRSYDEAISTIALALMSGKRVLVAADTARTAKIAHDSAIRAGLVDEADALLVIRETSNDRRVGQFLSAINTEAPKYKLLVYNSCMASGVSIDTPEYVPDVTVQFIEYLTPRTGLQLLNRCRRQHEVYCFVRHSERLYVKSAYELREEADRLVAFESALVGMPAARRLATPLLRDQLNALSQADEDEQQRSPHNFYMALVKRDGREVEMVEGPIYDTILEFDELLRDEYADQKEYVAAHWIDLPPLEPGKPIPASYTPLDIHLAETHHYIKRALRGNLPSNVPPDEIYHTVKEFNRYRRGLTALYQPDEAISFSIQGLVNRKIPKMALRADVTLVEVMTVLNNAFKDMTEPIKELTFDAEAFVVALYRVHQQYDLLVPDSHRYQVIYDKYDDDYDRAIAFVKAILRLVGLKLKTTRYRQDGDRLRAYKIDNLTRATNFIRWRHNNVMEELRQVMAAVPHPAIQTLTPEKRELIADAVTAGYHSDILSAIVGVQALDIQTADMVD
jgi:hypothetical protein